MTNPVRPLTGVERDALRSSIEEHGAILVPILVDQHGVIVDGHHRKAIADELGIECPTDQITVADEVQRLAMAIQLNSARRQLGLHERTALHEKLRAAGWSLRRITEVTGASPQTVMRDTAGVPDGTPDETVGRDGKTYPASRPQPTPPPVKSFDPGAEPADDDEGGISLDEDLADEPEPPAVDAVAEAIEEALDSQPDQIRHSLRNAVRAMRATTATVVADIDPEVAAGLVDADELSYEITTVGRQIAWLDAYRTALKRSGFTVMEGGRA